VLGITPIQHISGVWGTDDSTGLFSTRGPALATPTVVRISFTEQDTPEAYRHSGELGVIPEYTMDKQTQYS
jgi:hypothetical protein